MLNREEFQNTVMQRFEALRELHRHDNFYDFEKDFEKIWLELGREVLQQSLGEAPEERRKKNDSRPDSAA